LITDNGKLWIKEFLPGGGADLASTLVVGVGSAAETPTDSMLQFETARVDIDVISYDNVTGLLIFKGTLEPEMVGSIYEIGLFTQPTNAVAAGYGSRILTDFDQSDEAWSGAIWDTVNARIGADGIKHAPAASSTQSSSLGVQLDLSGYSGADTISLAFHNTNTNVASATVRLKTDASNYYYFSATSPAAGYNIASFQKSAALQTGSPNWSTINTIEIVTVSNSGGSSIVLWDGIRIEDADSINPEYLMLARKVAPAPIAKVAGIAKEIEYGIPISV